MKAAKEQKRSVLLLRENLIKYAGKYTAPEWRKTMRKYFLSVLFVLLLLSVQLSFAAPLSKVEYSATDKEIAFSFRWEKDEYVLFAYKSAQESGEILLKGKDGNFEGKIHLQHTYPGNIVVLSAKSASGREVLKKFQVKTMLNLNPPAAKADEGRLKGIKVCIDPGHQGVGIGLTEPMGPGLSRSKQTHNGMAQGVVTRRMESAVVLEIGIQLRDALLQEGADIVMTRSTQDIAVGNKKRAEIANEANADLTLRLHCNLTSNPNKTGIIIYIPRDSDYAKAVADTKTYQSYAQVFLDEMKKATGNQRGNVVANNSYVGNNWSKMPCFLVEMGYMSNPLEDLLLSDKAYQQKLVEGMVEGVLAFAKQRGIR